MKTILLFLFALLSLEGFSQEQDTLSMPYIYKQYIIEQYLVTKDEMGLYVVFRDSCTMLGNSGIDYLFRNKKADQISAYREAEKNWVADCMIRKVIPEEIVKMIKRDLEHRPSLEDRPRPGLGIVYFYDSTGKIYALRLYILDLFFKQLDIATIECMAANLKQEKLPFMESFDLPEAFGLFDLYYLIENMEKTKKEE